MIGILLAASILAAVSQDVGEKRMVAVTVPAFVCKSSNRQNRCVNQGRAARRTVETERGSAAEARPCPK
jgi:hypothetical protein